MADSAQFNMPRIRRVLNPATNQYEVSVLADSSLAIRFPEKPFGLAIVDLGLAPKDSKRYAGYVLVSIEAADREGKTHSWIFQKLSGPEWATISNSRENLTPQKFRGQTVVVKTEQEVVPSTAPTELSGNLVSSVVTQVQNTGKAVKVNVTETIGENLSPLVGQQFSPGGALLATSEVLVTDGAVADTGVEIAQSTVEPIGNGKSIKQTSTAKKRVSPEGVEVGWPTKQQKAKGAGSMVPAKFKNSVVTVVTKTQEPLTAAQAQEIPDPVIITDPIDVGYIAGVTSIEHEKVNDYRYEKSVTTEVIATTPTLLGQRAYVEKVVADVKEEYVDTTGGVAATGLNIIESSITALGNGKSVKDTLSIPLASPVNNTWPVHTSSQWDATLGVSVPVTEQFVTPYTFTGLPANFPSQVGESHRIINKHRALKTVQTIPRTALLAYDLSYPIRINLDLPKVLKAVGVVWNSQSSIGSMSASGYDFHNGESGSTSMSIPDSCSSSASVSAEILLTFEDYATGNLPAVRKIFYMEAPITTLLILTKLGATMWPVFKLKSETIAVTGQSISVSAKVNVSVSSSWSKISSGGSAMKSASGESSAGITNGSIQIPPCIHGAITFTGGTSRQQSVAAVATAAVSTTKGASASASISRSGTAGGSVYPTSLPATEGQNSIPKSGLYLMDMDVSPSEYFGWFKVRADVFDASALA